jgi:ABC-2 type transport system permease protein
VLFIVVAFSGCFYPVHALPGYLQPVSKALPSTHAFVAARAVLDGNALPWGELDASAVGLAVLIPLAILFLRHMLAVFKDRGYITRYT